MPLGFDALVIVLSARHHEIFWLFPPLVAAASVIGAALTYWIGHTVGLAALPRFVPANRLERIKSRLDRMGAAALAVAAIMPPPFPLTAFLLTCGALNLDRRWLFLVFGTMRLVRFGIEALLARRYGDRVLQVFSADTLTPAGMMLGVALVAAVTTGAFVLWSRLRPQPAS